MSVINEITQWLLPMAMVLLATGTALVLLRRLLPDEPETRVRRQITQLLMILVAFVVLALAVPLPSDTRGQLLSLFGLLLTGVLGLASTTFVSNAMAGFMLRSVASFKTGDFVRVGEHFGRVTETALLHTEIQSQDRDLITLPNLYLINQPVQVVRASGTLISAEVSLGYDVHRQRVRDALSAAAADAALNDAFVQIVGLGDFSISYRVSGFLEDVRAMVSKRSELHSKVLDQLHSAGIEIVSPSFMNQRPLTPEQVFIPKRDFAPEQVQDQVDAERLMFDKAALATRVEELKAQRAALAQELKALQESETDSDSNSYQQSWRERQIASIDELLNTLTVDPNEIR
ncbi:MAG: mechanosensitive ion channel domain-containing protein [Pseudomonadota bacterium]